MISQIQKAILDGHESQAYKGSQARYLLVNGRRRKLIEASGKVTEAGRAYYQVLGIEPPRLYAYEQPLIDDKWVMGFSGRKILVRRRVNGSWTVTKEGESYFRFNRDEYIVEAPYVLLKVFTTRDDYEAPHPPRNGATNIFATEHPPRNETDRQRMYAPIQYERFLEGHGPDWIHTVGNVRQARSRGRPLAATIEDKDREIRSTMEAELKAREILFNQETGNAWRELDWLYHDKIRVWDETRPFRISARRTNIYDEAPPTTEVILNRPLASRAVPDGFFRPWELHEDVFKTAAHACVVQMLHSCHVKAPSGAAKRKGITEYQPVLTPEAIEGQLDTIFDQLGYRVGEYPFERGWREDGATSEMVLTYCQHHDLRCYIYHRGGQVRSFAPDGATQHTPSVVYGIWGDHAYWFRKGSYAVKLAVRDQELSRGAYDEFTTRQIIPPFPMAPGDPFDEWGTHWQLANAIDEDFACLRAETRGKRKADGGKRVFWTTDINGTLERLQERQAETAGTDACFTLKTCYSDMDHLSRIIVELKELDFVIRDVPDEAESLSGAAWHISRTIPGFKYYGESLASFTEKVRIAVLKRRVPIDREAVAREQEFKCALCDEKLTAFEVDHIQPLSDGGTNKRDNLRALCLPCHAEVTRDQRLSVTGDAFYSELSQDLLEGFLDAPKPRQLVAGDGTPNCIEIDINRCRRYVLEKLLPFLPVASVLDAFQPYDPNVGLGDCHFVYVDAGPPLSEYYHWIGYHGPGWYGRYNARFMVLWGVKSEAGAITDEAYLMTFTPGRAVSSEIVADMYSQLDETLTKAFTRSFLEQPEAIEKRVKGAILAMTGSWLTQHRYDYRVVNSSNTADAPGPVAFQRGERLWSETEQLTNRTMYLWGLAALNGEHFLLLRAMRYTRDIPRLRIRGVLVDSILVTGVKKATIMERLEARYKDGSAIYSCKARRPARANAPEPRVSGFRKSAWRREFETPMVLEDVEDVPLAAGFGTWSDGRFRFRRAWKIASEEPGLGRGPDDTFQERMARLIVDNRGGYVAGRGGTGKSHLLKILKPLFQEAGFVVDVISTTHVQAANIDGGTIRHFLHAKARSKRHVIIVDESSMVSLRLWAALAMMQFTGSYFVVLGDVAGQLPPIQDAHRLDYWRKIEFSGFMHGLCRGLRVELNKFRRQEKGVPGDYEHFDFVGSIYPDKVSFEEALTRARALYPDPGGIFNGTTLVATNARRIAINEEVNGRLAPPWARFVKAEPNPKAPSQPQDAYLWPGLILASATTDRHHLKNGLRYRILEVGETVSLQRIDDEGLVKGEPFQMPEKEVVRDLRLQHAITYDSSQARTIYGPLRLEQTDHRHFSHRRLIVGLGRGPVGSQISVR